MLLILCTASFAPLIPWLGFYQDDWYQVWFGRAFGPAVFIDYYAIERPFIAAIYLLTTSLVGELPLNWQIFGLLCRWLAALSAWWTLRIIWPRQAQVVTWVALLFAIYPGFRQQYLSVIYSHYFIQAAVHIFSLGAMLLALRHPKRAWLWTMLALLAALFGVFTSEYFFGLELIDRSCYGWC